MTDTQTTIEEEVKQVLLGAADEMQRRHLPVDSMRPGEYYATYAVWWAAEGIRNHYGESSPPPYPYA